MNAGYSGTPLDKKLGLKPGLRAKLFNFATQPPAMIDLSDSAQSDEDLEWALAFCQMRDDLDRVYREIVPHLRKNGSLWISWPKKSSKIATEITEDTLRDVFLPSGLVDNKVCAVDEVWSGLRFVWRRELR